MCCALVKGCTQEKMFVLEFIFTLVLHKNNNSKVVFAAIVWLTSALEVIAPT